MSFHPDPRLFGFQHKLLVAILLKGLSIFDNKSKPPPEANSLGRFAVWGRPNTGKTTFINLLRGQPSSEKKEATTSKIKYPKFQIEITGRKFWIDGITDMPGAGERLDDWLELAKTHEHVFYLINLARKDDTDYITKVRNDLINTVKALSEITASRKRLHIIASHVDKSIFNEIDPAELTNVVEDDYELLRIRELIKPVAGYFYTVNFINDKSFKQLLKDIVNDSNS